MILELAMRYAYKWGTGALPLPPSSQLRTCCTLRSIGQPLYLYETYDSRTLERARFKSVSVDDVGQLLYGQGDQEGLLCTMQSRGGICLKLGIVFFCMAEHLLSRYFFSRYSRDLVDTFFLYQEGK